MPQGVAVLVVVLLAAFAYAEGPARARAQAEGGRFSGSVLVRGLVPAEGARVEARIGDRVCGSSLTFRLNGVARYTVDVPAGGPCGAPGVAVSFFVDGDAAGSTFWAAGIVLFDLSVPLPPAPTAARPTPTPPLATLTAASTVTAGASPSTAAATPTGAPTLAGTRVPALDTPAPAGSPTPGTTAPPIAPTPRATAAPAPTVQGTVAAVVPTGACGSEGPLTPARKVGCGRYELSFPLRLAPGESRNVTLEVRVTDSTVSSLLRVEKPIAGSGMRDDLGLLSKERYIIYQTMVASLEAPSLTFADQGRWVVRDLSAGYAVWSWNVQAVPGESGPQVLLVRVGPSEENVVTFPPAQFVIEEVALPSEGTPKSLVITVVAGAAAIIGGLAFNIARRRNRARARPQGQP